MAAYATAERATQSAPFRLLTNDPAPKRVTTARADVRGNAVFDELLGHLADLVAERLAVRLVPDMPTADEWLDTRGAAEYLGVHRDTVRRLAAERAVPSEQEGAGCKIYFRRRDLDTWRCSGKRPNQVAARRQAGARS
jgi:excisionase family DNA binding protein